MKKQLSLFIIFVLIFTLVGCSTAPAKTIGEATTEATTVNTADATTATNTADTTATVNTEDRNFMVSCAIQYGFYSVEDMHTYLTTGSTDINDYRYAPDYPLSQTPSPEVFLSIGYMPISEILEIDESLFDEVYASFSFNDDGSVTYLYQFDKTKILIRPAFTNPGETISQYYARLNNITLTNDSTATLNPDLSNSQTSSSAANYVIKKCCDYEVFYPLRNGIKKAALFLINGYQVTINFNSSSTDKTVIEDYNNFISAEKNAVFIPFFSDDQQVFETAVTAMINRVSKG